MPFDPNPTAVNPNFLEPLLHSLDPLQYNHSSTEHEPLWMDGDDKPQTELEPPASPQQQIPEPSALITMSDHLAQPLENDSSSLFGNNSSLSSTASNSTKSTMHEALLDPFLSLIIPPLLEEPQQILAFPQLQIPQPSVPTATNDQLAPQAIIKDTSTTQKIPSLLSNTSTLPLAKSTVHGTLLVPFSSFASPQPSKEPQRGTHQRPPEPTVLPPFTFSQSPILAQSNAPTAMSSQFTALTSWKQTVLPAPQPQIIPQLTMGHTIPSLNSNTNSNSNSSQLLNDNVSSKSTKEVKKPKKKATSPQSTKNKMFRDLPDYLEPRPDEITKNKDGLSITTKVWFTNLNKTKIQLNEQDRYIKASYPNLQKNIAKKEMTLNREKQKENPGWYFRAPNDKGLETLKEVMASSLVARNPKSKSLCVANFTNLPKWLKPIEDKKELESKTPIKRWFSTFDKKKKKVATFAAQINKDPLFETNLKARELIFDLYDYKTEVGICLESNDPQGWNIFKSVIIATNERILLKFHKPVTSNTTSYSISSTTNFSHNNHSSLVVTKENKLIGSQRKAESSDDEPCSKKRKLNTATTEKPKKGKRFSIKELTNSLTIELPNNGGLFAIISGKMDVDKLLISLRDQKSEHPELFVEFAREKIKLIVHFFYNQWGIALVSTEEKELDPESILNKFRRAIKLNKGETNHGNKNLTTAQPLPVATPKIVSNKDKSNPVLTNGMFAQPTQSQDSSNTNRSLTSSSSLTTPNYS